MSLKWARKREALVTAQTYKRIQLYEEALQEAALIIAE